MLGSAKQEPTNFDAEVRAPEKMVGEAMLGAEMEIVDEEPVKVDDDRVKYEKFRKELDVHRKRFQELLKEEQKLKALNKKKVLRKWRDIMRQLKTEELREQIQILSQQLGAQFERHDNLIDLALEDIMKLEEQFRTSQRSHLRKMDELSNMKVQTLREANQEFDARLHALEQEFNSERENIIQQQKTQMQRMMKTYQEVEDELLQRAEASSQAHDTEREETKNNNLEDYNVVKITLEGKLEKIEKGFDSEHGKYMDLAEDRTREYLELKEKDKKLATEIDALMSKNSSLQSQVTHWKKKLTNHLRECEGRNQSLRKEKDTMNQHYRELKNEMTKCRRQEHDRLAELTMLSRQAIKTNTEYLDELCAILRLAEMCRKFETEKEKLTKESSEDIGEAMQFELFWKRFNKVLLDKMVLDQQNDRLIADNDNLQSLLTQFQRDMSIPQDLMKEENSLLVLNGRLAMAGTDKQKKINVVEGNHIVNNYFRQLES